MRKRVLIAIFLITLLTGIGEAQQQRSDAATTTAPKTKLEAFEAQTGTVIIRGFSNVGSIRGLYGTSIDVEAREFTNATSGRKEYGITVTVKETQRLERDSTSYIDYDEIDSLLRGIDYIGKIKRDVTTLQEFQADYRTKGDLSVSTFTSGPNVMAAIKSGTVGETTAYLKLDDLAAFRKVISDAKAKLDSVKSGAPAAGV